MLEATMRPTDKEIEFVLAQLDRIARFRPEKALRMQLYLEQGAGGDVPEDELPTVDNGEELGGDSRDTRWPMSHKQERDRLAAEWARAGGGFMAEPATYAIDLERLVGRTAVAAPTDYRALAVATTWLAQHSQLVNVRRLGKVAGELEELPAAILGAMLEIAHETNSAADRLRTAQGNCRPLQRTRALFDRTEASPVLRRFAREGALPAFKAWGLWQDELTLKFDALRPVSWILEHCPELRLRALYGPGLEAEAMRVPERGPTTIAAIASYSVAPDSWPPVQGPDDSAHCGDLAAALELPPAPTRKAIRHPTKKPP